jgi:hypothetical protein
MIAGHARFRGKNFLFSKVIQLMPRQHVFELVEPPAVRATSTNNNAAGNNR